MGEIADQMIEDLERGWGWERHSSPPRKRRNPALCFPVEKTTQNDRPNPPNANTAPGTARNIAMSDDKNRGYVRNIIIGPGTLSFPKLDAPSTTGQYASGKYEASFLWPKKGGEAITKLLVDAAVKAAQEKWGSKITQKDLKIGIKNGDEKAHLAGYPNCWYITAKSSKKPLVVGGDRQPLPEGVKAQGSDTVRLCVTAGCYPNNVEKEVADALKQAGKTIMEMKDKDGKVVYFRPAVTFYLDMVQRLKGGAGFGGTGDPNAFPEESEASQFSGGDGPAPAAGAGDDPFG